MGAEAGVDAVIGASSVSVGYASVWEAVYGFGFAESVFAESVFADSAFFLAAALLMASVAVTFLIISLLTFSS